MNKKAKVLKDHKRTKKVLKPPLLQAMGGNHRPYSWVKELIPELIWISMLQAKLGNRRGVELANLIGMTASQISQKSPLPMFSKATSFLELSAQERGDVLRKFSDDGEINDIRLGLGQLTTLLPTYPLAFLFEDCNSDETVSSDVSDLLEGLYDRFSVISTQTQATAVYLGLNQGKIKIAVKNSPLENLGAIEDYPETDESKVIASAIRAMMGVFLMKDDIADATVDLSWKEDFWIKVSGIGECINEQSSNFYEQEKEPEDDLDKLIFRFCNAAKTELHERLDKWGFDLNEAEKYEVIGGLLARQTTLAVDLAMSPRTWTPSASPLFHRAMADVFITLSWIFKEPQERALKFIETGIGDVKLEVAHRKKRMQDEGVESTAEKQMVEFYEGWISSQRVEAMVEVNLANWSGITTRKMAEEADCLDFYNYVYQPFSAAVHSAWVHLSCHNLRYCENPAHRNHRLPVSLDYKPSPHFLYLSAKYLQKAFAKFDEETGIQTSSPSSFDLLYEDLYGSEESEQ